MIEHRACSSHAYDLALACSTTDRSMSLSATSTIKLMSDVSIPVIGFGVYNSDESVCVASCLTALEAGYRQIDSAGYYANERQVGEAVRKSGLDRREVFVTTKIIAPPSSMNADECYAELVEGVDKFGLGVSEYCLEVLRTVLICWTAGRLRRSLPHPHAELGAGRQAITPSALESTV